MIKSGLQLTPTTNIFERIVFIHSYEYVSSKLVDSQFGFRKHRSAVIQLLLYLDDIYKPLDAAVENLSVLYLDFKKAFDCVPHQKLVDKLFAMGIGGKALRLIQNYLFQRKQQVRIDDFSLQPITVTSGVPQGSILGRLLFILYVNNICDSLSSCKPFAYADDKIIIE